MTYKESHRNRQSWLGLCGYCHESVIWHKEWVSQGRPIPLNELERGGGKHSCPKYVHYQKMIRRIDSVHANLLERELQDVSRVIALDDIADWEKDKLYQAVRQRLRGRRTANSIMTENREPIYDPLAVQLGSCVVVRSMDIDHENQRTLHLVERKSGSSLSILGAVTPDTPVFRALLGHKVGDQITVEAPSGALRFKVLSVEQSIASPGK